MRVSASRWTNIKVRLAYGFAGLTVWAGLAALAERALAPYHGVFCLAGKELLVNIPLPRLCELVLTGAINGGAALISVPWCSWMGSIAQLICLS